MENRGKHSKRKTVKKQKPLGKAALRAIVKNETVVAEFMDALRKGMLPEHIGLGHVTRALGGGRFEVTFKEDDVKAGLSGILMGRGGFWHNPEASTAVRVGSWVVVEDIKLGHMAGGRTYEILAVLDSGQAAEARRLLRIPSPKSASENGNLGFEFDRSETIDAAAAMRAVQMMNAARALSAYRGGQAAAAAAAALANMPVPVLVAGSNGSSSNSNINWNALNSEAAREKKRVAFHRRKTAKKASASAAAGGGGGK